MEDLNLVGADIQMPPFRDSVLGTDSVLRRVGWKYGALLRVNVVPSYTQNTLAAPVSADQQAYIGERPFETVMENPILTYDLRSLHLHSAQLNVGGLFRWVTWERAGPGMAGMSTLYLYKSFGEDRAELKVGYNSNDFEFIGMQVGGSLASGALGVYAILPFEVGLSHGGQPAPSVNLKLRTPGHTYFKTSFQRSLDPGGTIVTHQRNPGGFRFIPKGDKLLMVFEGGAKRDAAAGARSMWLRGGYLYNATPYPNALTGTATPGNYCAYLLGDLQISRPASANPGHGFYAGASAMVVPAAMNAYTQYYELRLYDEAPFRTRPNDVAALVASRSVYSRDTIRNLLKQGQTVSHASNSLTASYTFHVARGVYVSSGLSYITGPAISPHLANALTATVQSSLFF